VTLTTHLLLFGRDLVLTVLVEGAVLWFALDPIHDRRTKLLAAWWLSTCTLPIVQFVFPLLSLVGWPRWAWVTCAEIFAPAAECAMFAALVSSQSGGTRRASMRDMLAIILANLASFGFGELLRTIGIR
jgi:hypothetical protein